MKYTKEQLQDILEWDVENWQNALPFWERYVHWNRQLNCLEVGARRGSLTLWLKLNGVVHVDCSDNQDTSI